MPYSGGSIYTNWLTLAYSGTPSPYAVSEDIPVQVDGITTYSAEIDAAPTVGGWAPGYTLTLTFYDGSSDVISAENVTVTNLLTTVHTQAVTPAVLAPAGSAYCTATIQYNNSPDAGNPLGVYKLMVVTGSNPNVPDVLNYNYAFVNGTWPWTGGNGAVLDAVASQLTGPANGAPDSLVINGIIELMGGDGGVECPVGALTDPATGHSAKFRISTPGGQLQTLSQSGSGPYDLGNPQPTQDFVESMLLDGERPFGSRTSNRTMSIPVAIYAPTQQTLGAARDYLLSVIDVQEFEVAWTPASTGLTTIYDSFRALPSTIMYGFNNLREGSPGAPAIGLVTITIQALPFGKSGIDGLVEIDFASGLISGSPSADATVLDDFTGAIDTADRWTLNTQYAQGSTVSVRNSMPVPMQSPWPAAVYQATLPEPVSVVQLPVLSLWFGQSYDSQWPAQPSFASNCTFNVVLYDDTGYGIACNATINKVTWNADPNKPAWTQVSIPIAQKNAKFNYSQVSAYKITVSNIVTGSQPGYVRMHAWLGQVSAQPFSISSSSSPRGVLYNMFGLVGSARSPVNAQVQLPSAKTVIQEYFSSGSWQVPAGVTSIKAEAFGPGGGGASVSSILGGGGGGGGEYACEPELLVTPGTPVPFTVGVSGGAAGDLSNGVINTWLAYYSAGVPASQTYTFKCPPNVTSGRFDVWGGGAAGAPGGGGGGGGEYASEATVPLTPGTIYYITAGGGGTPNSSTSAAAQGSRGGAPSYVSVNPPGTKNMTYLVYANGGQSPAAGSASGGAGGTGSSNTTHFNGGTGGRAPGTAGGGGGAGGGPTGAGAPGGASPLSGASGNYTVGGTGATGGPTIPITSNPTPVANAGGPGGAGASNPGAAISGTFLGGGGGGGYKASASYTANSSYLGAPGGQGAVRLTYLVAGGAAVKGEPTTFGSASTTGTQVVANGGYSVASNAAAGAPGGTGSSNTIHYDGGTGAVAGRRANYVSNAGRITSLLTGSTASANAYTSTPATATASVGVLTVAIGASGPLVNPSVADSSGNVYYMVRQHTLTDGSWAGVFATPVQAEVFSGTTTITVTTSTARAMAIAWLHNPDANDVDDASVADGGGAGASVTFPAYSNLDPTSMVQEVAYLFNNNTQAPTGFTTDPVSSILSNVAQGTMRLDVASKALPGSTSAMGWSATTFGSSAPYAAIMVPYVYANRQAQPFRVGAGNFTGTSGTFTFGANQPALEANSGYAYITVLTPGAGTVTVTDSGTNAWAAIGSVACGTGFLYTLGSAITHKLASASTITIADGTSQLHAYSIRFIKGGTGLTASSLETNHGTGTSATVGTAALATPGTFQVFEVGNVNTATTSGASFTNNAVGHNDGHDGSGALAVDTYMVQQAGTTATTLTATYAASQGWGVLTFAVTVPVMSGGGGSAAGPLAPGVDGTNGIYGGGTGYPGGGAGANGVLVNGAGFAGSVPGGGGSGAAGNSATINPGGSGGTGMVRVTHAPPLNTFNDFLLHRPSDQAPATLNPIIPIPVTDPPDNREYAVPATVDGRTAQFKGTYSILLCNSTWDTPGTSRRISVTINQYEYRGGPSVSVQATRTLTPATDITNGYIDMGAVTLPIKNMSPENSECYYTVSIHDTDQLDTFQDVLTLDTQGQTVLVDVAPGSAGDSRYVNYYVDEPSSDSDLGYILGSTHERDRAISVLDMAMPTGGPLYVGKGDNLLLAYSTKGAPNLMITYLPRWYSDRVV